MMDDYTPRRNAGLFLVTPNPLGVFECHGDFSPTVIRAGRTPAFSSETRSFPHLLNLRDGDPHRNLHKDLKGHIEELKKG